MWTSPSTCRKFINIHQQSHELQAVLIASGPLGQVNVLLGTGAALRRLLFHERTQYGRACRRLLRLLAIMGITATDITSTSC